MKTLLGVPKKKIDVLKYIRQLRSVVKWVNTRGRATIVAATGFGKTFLAFIAIKKLTKKVPNATTIVIVPTTALKEQWEKQIKSLKLSGCRVLVVNTVALQDKTYNCSLLIVDEIHMMASTHFRKIFTKIKYSWIMGLTATIERLDGKERLLTKYAPVCDTITQKEAIKNGWISDFVEINVPVSLSSREITGLDNLDKQIRHYMSKFGGDFEAMRDCMNLESAKNFAVHSFPADDPNTICYDLVKWAVNGYRMIKKRQEFLYKTQHKIDAAVELVNEFGLKTIMFSQSTEFADKVNEVLGDKSVVYHSNLETQTRLTTKTKEYKTESAATRFVSSKEKASKKFVNGVWICSWKEPVKFGVKRQKDEAIRLYTDARSKKQVLCTAKALDQGLDVKDIELGVEGSRTSNPTQRTQRTGRVARNFTYKDGSKKRGVYVNLFIPNSRDEGWLRSSQKKNADAVVWVNDLEECVSFVKELLR